MNKMVSKLITGFLAVMLALSSAAAQKSDQGEVQLKAAIQKQVIKFIWASPHRLNVEICAGQLVWGNRFENMLWKDAEG